MKITYNVERLRKTVDDICILTGVSMAIANADHTFLYANASQSYRFCSLLQENPACRERCRQCDQQMMHRADALGRPSHRVPLTPMNGSTDGRRRRIKNHPHMKEDFLFIGKPLLNHAPHAWFSCTKKTELRR